MTLRKIPKYFTKNYGSSSLNDGYVPIILPSSISELLTAKKLVKLPTNNFATYSNLIYDMGSYIASNRLSTSQKLNKFFLSGYFNRRLKVRKRVSSKPTKRNRLNRARVFNRFTNKRLSFFRNSGRRTLRSSKKPLKAKIEYDHSNLKLSSRIVNSISKPFYSLHYSFSSIRSLDTYKPLGKHSVAYNMTALLKSPEYTSNLIKTLYGCTYASSRNHSNLYPSSMLSFKSRYTFKPKLTKELDFYSDVLPWVNDSVIRLIEVSSGRKGAVQHSMRAENAVDLKSRLEYKKWILRMAYYERNLGHRFFMEEALHIIHLSFRYHDVTLFSSWLKAIITRISFWKTRSIFRFLKYVFNNYYRFIFDSLSIKGIKIRLKGKISAAGNSRKRTILFRSGKNSYSSVNIKCIHEFQTITTFTGVMGFQVWLFY
jgi:hypothetical protein